MDDPAAVRVVQRTGRLVDQLDHIVDPQQIVRPAICGQRAGPVHVLRDDVAMTVLFARVVDRQDVGMLQHADHVRFGEEHLARDLLAILVAARIDVVDLDRDVASIVRIVREIHGTGTAAADLVDDGVLADLFGDRRARVRRLREIGPDGVQGSFSADLRSSNRGAKNTAARFAQTVIWVEGSTKVGIPLDRGDVRTALELPLHGISAT
jgi:hypothetical protein